MKNLKRGKIPILTAMVIIFIVGFFVLMFMLYDLTIFLYNELLILIETVGKMQ